VELMEHGPLRLKGSRGALGAGKQKKKAKDKAQIVSSKQQQQEERKCRLEKWTLVQVAFKKMQEKWQMEQILKKAPKTHEQRVEEFNRHLGPLTEHYDVPKVSWTK
ncbi:FA32A protein, partial [Oreocharis arfaki]|nr:FA32A protein [Oreocharis arfaki]